ncbi:MAG: hypothetical protein ACREO3_01795 [Arenimonas sp.]
MGRPRCSPRARAALTPDQQRLARDELLAADSIEAGEMEAMKRTLDRAGVPREPPPGWEPTDPTELMTAMQREANRAAHPQGR